MNKSPFRFKMSTIRTEQFAILLDSMPEELGYDLSAQLGYVDKQTPNISLRFLFSLHYQGQKALVFQLECIFDIHPEDWKGAIKEHGEVVVEKHHLDFLLVQTIGVARGILHCKVEGTPFASFILPPLDVSEMITDPLVIQ